jgi:uncharacterized membrane protein required for colicin V production
MIIRVTMAMAGIAAGIVVTSTYYAQAVECLGRMEKLAHAAIPACLAVALLYHVILNILGKKQ